MDKEFLYISPYNQDFTPGSFRDYYSKIYGTSPCPVDRFGLLDNIEPQKLKFKVIVPKPIYNLENLTNDWEDRFWDVCDQVGRKVFDTANGRPIALMYSGGIDSTAALVSMMKDPRYKEYISQDKLKLVMNTNSIYEYPEFFYRTILKEIPLMAFNYNDIMNDPTILVVTGDAGDYVIGNTDTPIFMHNGNTDNMSADKSILWPYLDTIDKSGKFSSMMKAVAAKAPFDIVSVNQMYWWWGQAFVHQGEMCYPYLWSSTSDLSTLPGFNKVYRFFLDDLWNTYSFEYMSTNPYYTNFNSVRNFARNYIVDYTGDRSYLNKVKVFSQRLTVRRLYKTRVYADLTYEFTTDKITT